MQELRKTNIHEVAELAGVSAMTVTRTFNASGPVAEKTRARIMKAAAKLGYRPNIMARSLRSGKTNTIGLLWSLGGPHDSIGLVRNITIRLMRKDYACHVADSLTDPKIIEQCLADFCGRKTDGVILQAENDLLKNRQIVSLLKEISNVVLVMSHEIESEFDVLVLNRSIAINEMVDHLVKTGRKRPAFFLASPDLRRQITFIERLKFHNLEISNDSVINLDNHQFNEINRSWGAFAESLKTRFDRHMPFDSLICSCDEGAAAVINFLESTDYRVPEDIAVIGFNDSGMAPYFKPPLASVDRRNDELANLAAQMLLTRINNPGIKLQREHINMKFVWRESAG